MNMISSPLRAASALAVVTLALAACGDPVGPDGGIVQFTLSAVDVAPTASIGATATAPAASGDEDGEWDGSWNPDRPRLQSANVTFSSVLARNYDGVLVDVDMELPVTVDIIAMAEGQRSVSLPEGDLPPGTYDQVVVVMTAVQVVTADGTTITVEPPGGGWTAVVNMCPFEVAEGGVTEVPIVLPVRTAFSWDQDRFRFEPRFRTAVRNCEMPPPEEP